MDSTVISDTVNAAFRIEGLTKGYQIPLLISEHTLALLVNPENYYIRMVDTPEVKGRSEPVTVYEVFDVDSPDLRSLKLATKTQYEQALHQFHQQEYRKALDLFQECQQKNPADPILQTYIERCQTLCPGLR